MDRAAHDVGCLIHTLVDLTVDDEARIASAVDELHQHGLVCTGEHGLLGLTVHGNDLFERVNAARTDLRHRLYDDIPTEELAAAMRVLSLVAERASAVQAGH